MKRKSQATRYNVGMNNSSPNAASKAVPSGKSKPASSGKTILTVIIIVACMIFAAFGIGFWQGRLQLIVEHARHEQAITKLNATITQAQSDLIIAQNRGELMQARAALYRSAIDLDKRNFGTANLDLKEAAQSLGKINNSSSELKSSEIAQLRDAISKTNINVAVNLEVQRAQVLDFATKLNELIPEAAVETPPVAAPTKAPALQ